MKIAILILLITSLVYCEYEFSSKPQVEYFSGLLGEDLTFYTETGYVTFKDAGSIFYHLILQEGTQHLDNIKATDTVAIWLNGGPGSSSQLGNYMEIGPWVVTKSEDKDKPYTFTKRQYPWNQKMHLLFIDQPFGAGMSPAYKDKVVTNSDQAADYFVKTLTTIYSNKSQLKAAKTYIFGESYGGHYVPAFAAALIKSADALKMINFKGVAIVDGLTDTVNQFGYYSSYLLSIGAVSISDMNLNQQQAAKGQQAILNGDYTTGGLQLGKMTEDNTIKTGDVNVYNIRRYNGQDDYDYAWANFLNDNVKQFTDELTGFQKGNQTIYDSFMEDIGQSRLQDVVDLLNKKYKVLLINGQLDYIINTPGQINWIYKMKWLYQNQWIASQKQIITTVNDETGVTEPQGYIKTYENLSYATFYKAGHMVPTDNPKAAKQVIENFIK